MRELRIYLDTSVVNFLFADDAPEKRDATAEFFERVVRYSKTVFVSQLVVDEIGRTRDEARREKLRAVLRDHDLPMLRPEPETEVEMLATAYQRAGAIPAGQREDALHVAVCTVNMVDVLAS